MLVFVLLLMFLLSYVIFLGMLLFIYRSYIAICVIVDTVVEVCEYFFFEACCCIVKESHYFC